MEFAREVQEVADREGGELKAAELRSVFDGTYLNVEGPYGLERYDLNTVRAEDGGADHVECTVEMTVAGQSLSAVGQGNGPIDALFVKAVEGAINEPFEIEHYHEQSEEAGSGARALPGRSQGRRRRRLLGAGGSQNTVTASFEAVLAALNRRSRD